VLMLTYGHSCRRPSKFDDALHNALHAVGLSVASVWASISIYTDDCVSVLIMFLVLFKLLYLRKQNFELNVIAAKCEKWFNVNHDHHQQLAPGTALNSIPQLESDVRQLGHWPYMVVWVRFPHRARTVPSQWGEMGRRRCFLQSHSTIS